MHELLLRLENNDDLVQKIYKWFLDKSSGEWKIDDGSDSLDLEKYISRNLKWINLSDVVFYVKIGVFKEA